MTEFYLIHPVMHFNQSAIIRKSSIIVHAKMNFSNLKVFMLVLLLFSGITVHAFEPVTTGLSVGIALVSTAFMAGFDLIKCQVYECCNDDWISPNMTGTVHRARTVGMSW